jgi:hypothetical protein
MIRIRAGRLRKSCVDHYPARAQFMEAFRVFVDAIKRLASSVHTVWNVVGQSKRAGFALRFWAASPTHANIATNARRTCGFR